MEVKGRLAEGLALIFDLDGVIVDSNPVHEEVWRLYMKRFGIQLEDKMLSRMYGRRNDEILSDFFGDSLSPEETRVHSEAKEALYRERMITELEQRLVPGVRSFLERHRDSPIGLATNAEPANVEFVLQHGRLHSFFRAVFVGRQVDRPKPSPDIYLLAARALRTAPHNCIIFEDSAAGVEAAHSAGARLVGVTTTHSTFPHTSLNISDFLNAELESWLCRQRPYD